MQPKLPVLVIVVILLVFLCVLFIIMLKCGEPSLRRRSSLPRTRTIIHPAIPTHYRLLVQSTVDWLENYGLPLSWYTRVIFDRLVTGFGPPESRASPQSPSPILPVYLQRPPPCYH
ncbi:hypothetical protein M407DRAFT_23821 [Tulasnella calospora MUT 4182]|uniref:Uncharacterized protein n=1 Tax=Tulasnella calospora MUT 4182 TaxID=1051891 RepID=A0A0C3QKF8_9AGAM|nr:hypothetical protein M407DRAFT_23821 [Tulasnella calospora MUT 4182]